MGLGIEADGGFEISSGNQRREDSSLPPSYPFLCQEMPQSWIEGRVADSARREDAKHHTWTTSILLILFYFIITVPPRFSLRSRLALGVTLRSSLPSQCCLPKSSSAPSQNHRQSICAWMSRSSPQFSSLFERLMKADAIVHF